MHKAILSKVPYFNASVRGGFKVDTQPSSLHKRPHVVKTNTATILQETAQEKITIEEFFEPFEVQWLLSYIYFPCKRTNRPNLLLVSKWSTSYFTDAPSLRK